MFKLLTALHVLWALDSSQQGSVEYAELNHDNDQHGDHTVLADNSVDNNMADQGECECDTTPGC